MKKSEKLLFCLSNPAVKVLKIFVFNIKSPYLFKNFAKKSHICCNFVCIFLFIFHNIKLDNFRKASYNTTQYLCKGFAMAATKIRSNLYLDKELKEKAKEIFKEYGLSLSDGINMLLNRVVKNRELIVPKELDIEPIDKDDPDYKLVEKTRGEETISLEEFMKL